MNALQIILFPFSWLLSTFNSLTGSYALALILFAIVVKVVLFPFSLKGKKSMIKMNMLSGDLEKLKRQYGKDQNRYNAEVQKLYEREKVSPMGGCLWTLIPLIILMLLYAIIRRPLFYTMGLNDSQILQVANTLDWNNVAFANGWIKEAAEFTSTGYNELFLGSLINESNLSALQAAISPKIASMNLSFLGMNLAEDPDLKFWLIKDGLGLILLPILSAVTGFLSSLISTRTNNFNKSQQNQGSNKMMMVVSPLISLWIGFSMPAILSVYWIISNILTGLQELLSGRILKKDYEKAAAAKAEQERLAKEAEKEEKRRKAEERARRIEEEKLNKGKKKKSENKGDDDSSIPSSVKEASREGMRQYARGRGYDPNRYGAVTPYTEYVAPVDKKTAKKNEAAEKEKQNASAAAPNTKENKADKTE